ncbi:MAG: hypothetical protein ACTHKU_15405 [Verrucomicrobiota bacterium]
MSYLLFPGRHLVNTRFQEAYLQRILTTTPSHLPGFIAGRSELNGPPSEIIFAITSANQENSRFNPVPFHVRAMGVDRFARELRVRLQFRFRVIGIPHYGHTENFAEFTIKEIAYQTEHAVKLTPGNCVVLCSTPEVTRLYQSLGFAVRRRNLANPWQNPPRPSRSSARSVSVGTTGGTDQSQRLIWQRVISACSKICRKFRNASRDSIKARSPTRRVA